MIGLVDIGINKHVYKYTSCTLFYMHLQYSEFNKLKTGTENKVCLIKLTE